jgi:hypothetical protein
MDHYAGASVLQLGIVSFFRRDFDGISYMLRGFISLMISMSMTLMIA